MLSVENFGTLSACPFIPSVRRVVSGGPFVRLSFHCVRIVAFLALISIYSFSCNIHFGSHSHTETLRRRLWMWFGKMRGALQGGQEKERKNSPFIYQHKAVQSDTPAVGHTALHYTHDEMVKK